MSKGMTVSDAGRKGGKARANRMTKDERSDSARHAANQRWSMRNDKQQESCQVIESAENKSK